MRKGEWGKRKNLSLPPCEATADLIYYLPLRAMEPLRKDENKERTKTWKRFLFMLAN